MKTKYIWYGIRLAAIVLILLLNPNPFVEIVKGIVESVKGYITTTTPTQGVPILEIENVEARLTFEFRNVWIYVDVTVKNTGNGSFNGNVFARAVAKGVKDQVMTHLQLKPGETSTIQVGPLVIERRPGEYEYVGTVYLRDDSGNILDTRNFTVTIPTARIGDTFLIRIPGAKLELTLNSWYIEPHDRGLVNLVVNVTIKNYSKLEEDIPQIYGDVMTDKRGVYGYTSGRLYCPTSDNPNNPCPSTLPPEGSLTGLLKIKGIPKDQKPVELRIWCYGGYIEGGNKIIILNSQSGSQQYPQPQTQP